MKRVVYAIVSCCLIVSLTACTALSTDRESSSSESNSTSLKQPDFESLPVEALQRAVFSGQSLLAEYRHQEAIEQYFTPVIKQCEGVYGANFGVSFEQESATRLIAARNVNEQMYYSVKATVDQQRIQYIPYVCIEAMYLWGYAGIAIGNTNEAANYLNRAANLSPGNSVVLSALGYLHHVRGDWQEALSAFARADKAAGSLSPEALKQEEALRAKQGLGHSLIELGRLDEAKLVFAQCLAIAPDDPYTLKELRYIESLVSWKSGK